MISDEESVQICKNCFDRSEDKFIVTSIIPKPYCKSQFKSMKNDIYAEETFIPCSKCGRKWHSICALHISTSDNPFLCRLCSAVPRTPQIEFSSERIPTTGLSEYIEERVNCMIKNQNEYIEKVVVRMLADSSLTVTVKPEILEHFADKTASTLPYRSKAIYAFQKIDGYDVVFFALYTQEYDSSCPAPNTGKVYISYLDSVHYFQPRHLRTDVYHEIIISYFDYCKMQKFLTAHLWACPPGSGDDYVFHQHPIEQKVPKQKRLIKWYKELLEKGVQQNVIRKYMHIHEYMTEYKITTPGEMPYFEGDFWPNAISDMLTKADEPASHENPKKCKLSKKKIDSNKDVSTRMLQLTKAYSESFLVIILNTKNTLQNLITTTGKIFNLKNTALLEMRASILDFCREHNLEFSDLRRAKFTTMRILDELFRENQKESFYCDACKKANLKDRYSCPHCIDFDLCPVCYEMRGHDHSMNRVIENSGEIKLGAMLDLLNKAIRCRRGCRESGCVMMKNLLLHSQRCRLSYEDCIDCYRYTVLMVNHTHHCHDSTCRFLFCKEKREKDKRRECRILLSKRLNEIQRYQATKQNTENNGVHLKSEPIAIVTSDDLNRKVYEFKQKYPVIEEFKVQFFRFLADNPEYKAALEASQFKQGANENRQIKNECIQLGKRTNNADMAHVEPIVPTIPIKPESTEKKHQKSDYFIKSPENYQNVTNNVTTKTLPRNHVTPISGLTLYKSLNKNVEIKQEKKIEIKQEQSIRATPLKNPSPKKKKCIQITKQ